MTACLFLAAANHSLAQEVSAPKAAKAPPVAPTPRQDSDDISFRRAPMTVATRSVHIPLATNLHMAFDPELLRTHAAWQGETLNLWGTVYHQAKDRYYCDYQGETLWTMPHVFPWSVRELTEKGFTNAVPERRFRGISTKGGVTTLQYDLSVAEVEQTVRVHESARHRPDFSGNVIERRFEISPTTRSLTYLAHVEPGQFITNTAGLAVVLIDRGTNVLLMAARADCNLRLETKMEEAEYEGPLWTEKKNDSELKTARLAGNLAHAYVRIPVHTNAVAVEILTLVAPNAEIALVQLQSLPKTTIQPPRMNFAASPEKDSKASPPAVFTGEKGFLLPGGDEAYRLEQFPLPKEIELQVTGMDFLPNGDLAVCTWLGDLYIVEQAQGAPAAAKYRRFARGLCEPGGLKVIDGDIYVVQKQELTRLRDTDGNGEADLFECLSQDWGFTGNYHDFSFGPVQDSQGNFYVYRNGNRGIYEVPYMGWALKISPDGHRVEPFCSGFRSPNGFGTWGPNGDLFMSDNQGNWIGVCTLNHLQKGRFFGFPSTSPAPKADFAGKRDGKFSPPAVWFPYKLAKSTSDIKEIEDDRFGPFKGQMLVGDWQNAIVVRVDLEQVKGEWQGAVFPFAKGFGSGVNRMAFGPDGKLYVGGCKNRAWAAIAPKEAALDRVSFTGKIPFEIQRVRALPDGFELTFTQPVEAADAGDLDSYDVLQHRYLYHSKYGSPEIDHEGAENSATGIAVTGASVSPDRLQVRLKLAGWKPGYVTTVRALDVVNEQGKRLRHDTFYYTLNQIPAK